mmetsp:Transcript_27744/g.31807  ORF Transcript_27744/g.31807 Transcript_27744/m.31807 type:complete len:253 (+) Transcript_27744:121-879(+)
MPGQTIKQIRKATDNEVKSILSEGPSTLGAIEETLTTHFPTYKLSEVETQYINALSAYPETPNTALFTGLQAYTDTLAHVINIIQTLERYITIHIPQMEDGNNFGVTVQMTISKALKEVKESLMKKLDSVPTYSSSRAEAVDKLGLTKEMQSTTKTTTKVDSKGGKDGDENKESKTEVLEMKSTGPAVAPEQNLKLKMRIMTLVKLDVNCYANARIGLVECRDSLLMILDNVEKNKEKLSCPKGNGSSMGMY